MKQHMWSAYVAQCHTLYSLTKLCRKSGTSSKALGMVSLNLYFIFISLLSFFPCLSESWQCSFMRFLLSIPVFHPGCCQHCWRGSCPACSASVSTAHWVPSSGVSFQLGKLPGITLGSGNLVRLMKTIWWLQSQFSYTKILTLVQIWPMFTCHFCR